MTQMVFEQHKFSGGELSQITTAYIDQYPIVYILYNRNEKNRPTAYIGQTVQVDKRMRAHLKDSKRKGLTDTLLIGNEKFNQSATYNIETNLINHFIGDEKFKLQNVSQTRQIQTHGYYDKNYYDTILFNEIWEYLRQNGLADNSSDVIQNKDIYKVSPYKELSPKQLEIKNEIIEYCKKSVDSTKEKVFMIEGEAGTGKSVVLASLYNTLQDLAKDKTSSISGTDNYLLVNHGEMIKTYHSIAESLPNLKKNHILRPTSFINEMDKKGKKADIVLIDEAHLLLTKEDRYNNFYYKNQLEEIIKRSKITIFIFDPKQILRTKSYWTKGLMEQIDQQYGFEHYSLTDQFRMKSSEDTLKWIDNFHSKKISKLPKSTEDYSFEIMPSPESLKEKIETLDKKVGLARIVSVFDYLHKKDQKTYYVDEDGLHMPWNTTESKTTWAERADTIEEVGSIYTVQGFDLNHVGVFLGPSIDYDQKTDSLVIDISKYKDTGAFMGREDLSKGELLKCKEEIILNSLNTLMKRSIHGIYIYAVNESLRNRLLELQERRDAETNY
ncbi:DUF2075 domain-containing protein [Enterococcus avium]|uniref:DUF2075 domain-containing protein n=1 Tax=Enterococcus avium TaxID=33945 RepID=UPI0028909373|nr:DUF2075 domain-containing protein [Enterococcus avium]MDT2381859.1 DUF2075 domain-containing protein [Enterococcus avium]MDT2386328.1 DUF2075 domain-containing protein [Enterococcus avium]MDT2462333.1 DUF2075 domain-containing protein [Enterococcus avium]MDT2497573.1 DUF2075 domain-containing protein [Enterococcus avium]